MLNSLHACKAAGIPVYQFGSQELADMHQALLDTPVQVGVINCGWTRLDFGWAPTRTTFPRMAQRYRKEADGAQYVVDHGGVFTLNTIHGGLVCPEMQDIAPH